MAFLGYGNGTMYEGTAGSPRQTGSFKMPGSTIGFQNGLTNMETTYGGSRIFGGSTLGGFNALTWCKNIIAIMFYFFSKELSTPYSGQLFPTGTSVGSAGQVYPTRG